MVCGIFHPGCRRGGGDVFALVSDIGKILGRHREQ